MAANGDLGTAAVAANPVLFGTWESTEAFGNTSLDWSQALKDQKAQLRVTFESHFEYTFALFARESVPNGEKVDVTATFRHVGARKGKYELQGSKGLKLEGASSYRCLCCCSGRVLVSKGVLG